MPYGPNFTKAELKANPEGGRSLVATGVSVPPIENVVGIVVVMRTEHELEPVQGNPVPVEPTGEVVARRFGAAASPAIVWEAIVDAPDYLTNGDTVLAYGVETRRSPFRSTTWSQPLIIGADPINLEA